MPFPNTNSIGFGLFAWWGHGMETLFHNDVIKWKHFPRDWPFVREIHRSPVNFPHKGQWRGALMFSLIYAWINDWVNNREAGDLRRQHGHYDVIVMRIACPLCGESTSHRWCPLTGVRDNFDVCFIVNLNNHLNKQWGVWVNIPI